MSVEYRIWDKDREEMHSEDGISHIAITPNGRILFWQDCPEGQFGDSLHDDFIAMLYTRLNDRNGKKIYEGDILRSHVGYLPVTIKDGQIWAIMRHKSYLARVVYGNTFHQVEVVGNIYEDKYFLQDSLDEGWYYE